MHEKLGLLPADMKNLNLGKPVTIRLDPGRHSEVGKHYDAMRTEDDPHKIHVVVVAHTTDNNRNIITIKKK
jgi:hypothetical protein